MIFQYKIRHFAMVSMFLSLFACTPYKLQQQAILDATNSSEDVHSEYLSCYALDRVPKAKCTAKLATKYIDDEKYKKNVHYVAAFRFKSEKLGFQHFLQNEGLACESVEGGPIFSEANKAYEVKCQPDQQYLMQFDYNNKTWKLIKEDK